MHEKNYIGKPLGGIAKLTGANPKGYVVFVLHSTEDDTGKRIGSCMRLCHIIREYPYLKDCIVRTAYDYYGQTIIRVQEKSYGKSKNVRNE